MKWNFPSNLLQSFVNPLTAFVFSGGVFTLALHFFSMLFGEGDHILVKHKFLSWRILK